MQLAKTRCWAMYSNWGEKPHGWVNADPFQVLPTPKAWPDPGPAHLVDVIQFEVLEQEEQNGRNGFDDDLLVPIDIHPQLHALQHCGPGAHREMLGLGQCLYPSSLTLEASAGISAIPWATSRHLQTVPGAVHASQHTTKLKMVIPPKKP